MYMALPVLMRKNIRQFSRANQKCLKPAMQLVSKRQEKMLFLNINQISADESHRCNSHLLGK